MDSLTPAGINVHTCMYVLIQSKGMDTMTAATPEAAPAVRSHACTMGAGEHMFPQT